ncbi:hypothetical protein [Salinisphaera sp. T31B1]|uniref:hypothetical protein n=1 Tax=Salinisphaera sp. T31B1 TaxID=727963 RepID=UPI00333E435E
MSQFDIGQFEDSVDTLLRAHQRLLADYRALREALEAEQQRTRETRERLNGVIERIKALETEADNV